MEFTGMALYTKDEIGSALETYKQELRYLDNLMHEKITRAEKEFKPSWLDLLFGVKSLKEKKPKFIRYKDWLYETGQIEFTEDEVKKINDFSLYSVNCDLGYWLYEDEYHQVKNLYNGGKDCYLNPNQAAFVNKYKSKGE